MSDDVTRRKIQAYISDAHAKLDYLLENTVDDREMVNYVQGAMRDVGVALTLLGTSYVLQSGNLKLDKRSRSATLHGKDVYLTPKEFDFVAYLMENSGRAVPNPELYSAVWGHDLHNSSDEAQIRVLVVSARKKIGSDAIQTVRNAGYMM